MRYLDPAAPVMALAWMTPIEQYLGLVNRAGNRRIRWVRVDPTTAPGIVVSVHEADLAYDPERLDVTDHRELDPDWPLPDAITIRSELDAPSGQVPGNIEAAALLRAEHETGARRDRWVNTSVAGWYELRRLRGDGDSDRVDS